MEDQMNTVNSFALGIKKEAEHYQQQADYAQMIGDVATEQQLRHQAKQTFKRYYALEGKRKKQINKLITALEQPTLFE